MEQEIFTEEIMNKKELISELHDMADFLDHRIDAKNPAELASFFCTVIDVVMERQQYLVKALMKELCAEKDVDYDAFIKNMHRKHMNEFMGLLEKIL